MTDSTTTPEVDFSFVRYANCWEDSSVLTQALLPAKHKRFLSIASAGDNSLSLLVNGSEVVATDLNPTQLACTELRKEAIRQLNQPAFLAFCGITEFRTRQQTYAKIRDALSEPAQFFWDSHASTIQNGFIHAGKFENYFRLFRTRVLPLVHSRKNVSALMQPMNTEERKSFYDKVWNNWRWRLLFRFFFSKQMMGKHGRDPEFFKHVEGSVADRILERTRYALTELDTSNNPYLIYILNGNYGHSLPDYLLPSNYESIQQNIDRLTVRKGSIDTIAKEYGPNSFDGFNLSDIFEYLSPEQCETVYTRLLDAARPKARVAYWNMLVSRHCPTALTERIRPLEEEANILFKKDRAFFYSRFVLEEVQ